MNKCKVQDIIVLGTGNHDIVRLIETINEDGIKFNLIGFLEKNESLIGQSILGYPILGNDGLLQTEYRKCGVIVNIFQSPQLHHTICSHITNTLHDVSFPNLIHPSVCTNYVEMGIGNIIYESVNLGTDVLIGNHNILYPHSALGHETKIGDSNLIAINVTIGARNKIGNCNLFANSSTLSLGLVIGDNNSIGVGSVVIDKIGSNQSLLGNPAKDSMKVLVEHIKHKRI